MVNPIQEIREKKGWTIQELVSVTGISFTAIFNCLTGNTRHINMQILKVVEQLGYEPEEVSKKYQEYREAKKAALLQEAKIVIIGEKT
jgi:transcriptional regulator with XRE-family HTH domain